MLHNRGHKTLKPFVSQVRAITLRSLPSSRRYHSKLLCIFCGKKQLNGCCRKAANYLLDDVYD